MCIRDRTGLDETNIILAMYASQLNHCKVVAKINRKSFADVVTERGLVDSLVSTGAVTTELIVQYVRAMQNSQATNVRTLHRLVGGKVEALEFGVTADVPFAGVPLRDLNPVSYTHLDVYKSQVGHNAQIIEPVRGSFGAALGIQFAELAADFAFARHQGTHHAGFKVDAVLRHTAVKQALGGGKMCIRDRSCSVRWCCVPYAGTPFKIKKAIWGRVPPALPIV